MNRMKQDVLGQSLRDEGIGMGAAFSPELHERVMGALAAAEMKDVEPFEGRRSVIARIGIPLSIAAALAIAAGTWAVMEKTGVRVQGPGPVATGGVNSGAGGGVGPAPELTPNDAMSVLDAHAAGDAGDDGRYAYLDRDAERFVSFVADQVPQFPQEAAQ